MIFNVLITTILLFILVRMWQYEMSYNRDSYSVSILIFKTVILTYLLVLKWVPKWNY
jgi:hypothetical protein